MTIYETRYEPNLMKYFFERRCGALTFVSAFEFL